MSVKKYLHIDSGVQKERASVVSGGSTGQAYEVVALSTEGKLNENMMPDGIAAETTVAEASEALAANDVVNIHDDAGTRKVRKADGTDSAKSAHGYVKDGVTLGNSATVHTDGYLPGTGLTIGSRYFLSAATPGAITTTAPSTTGAIMQKIGVAVSATAIKFEPLDFIVRA